MADERERDTGRYMHSAERPCVCGHGLDEHTAVKRGGMRSCLHGTGIDPATMGVEHLCDCDAYRPRRRSRDAVQP